MSIQPIPIIDIDDISALLDETRQRHGLTSDEKLARLLGVSDQAIYRWRRGQIDKSARVLATLMRDRNPSSCT